MTDEEALKEIDRQEKRFAAANEKSLPSRYGHHNWCSVRGFACSCCTLFVDMEVRGVEPLSETESAKLLRVYPAFSLGNGKRTSALSHNHPFGSAPCSGRAELPAAWSDKLSLPAHRTSAVRLRGR